MPKRKVLKTFWGFLKIIKVELPYDPAVLLLGIYQKEVKATKCMHIHIHGGIFTVAKRWVQPECPPTSEWISKM